jgi:hypothetical protein
MLRLLKHNNYNLVGKTFKRLKQSREKKGIKNNLALKRRENVKNMKRRK